MSRLRAGEAAAIAYDALTEDRPMALESTWAWCTVREHPFITYNPWLDRSFCRCGKRQEAGDQPQDWQAKHEVFHNHAPGAPCRCYLPAQRAATA